MHFRFLIFGSKNEAIKTINENNIAPNKLTESVSQEIMKELGYMLVCVDDNYQDNKNIW